MQRSANAETSKKNNKERILITGAGGLLGNSVCHLLHKLNLPIIALYKNKPQEKILWTYNYGDIEKDNLQKNFEHQNISTIIHCAAIIPNEQNTFENCYRINTVIDKNISDYVVKNNVRKLIFTSTTNMYGISTMIINETSELKIDNLYSRAKLKSENLFFSLKNVEAISLRINAPYHYSQKSKTVLKIFIENIINDKDVSYHGSGARQQDFIHVKDVASAVLSSLRINKTGIYNIASGNAINMKDLAELILSKVPESKSKIKSCGFPDPQEEHKALFDITKAKAELSWQPKISLNEGINEWIKYIQQC